MLIVKAGVIILAATAGVGAVSVSLTPAEPDTARAVQYSNYEQVIQTADINYPASPVPEF